MAEKREFTPGDRVRVGKHEGVVSPSLNTVRVRFDDIGSAFDIAEHCVHLIEAAPKSPKIRFWTCPAGDHRGTGSVEWRDKVAYCLVPGCDWNSTRPRPVHGEPEARVEYNEDGEPEPGTESVGWDIAFGCRQTFSRDGDGFHYFLSISDATVRRGCEKRGITAEQIRAYAYHLLELARPAPVDDRIGCATCEVEPGTYCTYPDCGPAPVDGSEPSFHGLPEDKTTGVQSEDDPTVMVYPDGSTDKPVDGAARDARAADRAPCDTPGCPCGGIR